MPAPPRKHPAIRTPYRCGDPVKLTCGGRTVDAMVTLASSDGRSLMLIFEALLLGHAGMMPVLQADDGQFYTLVGHAPVEIVAKRKTH